MNGDSIFNAILHQINTPGDYGQGEFRRQIAMYMTQHCDIFYVGRFKQYLDEKGESYDSYCAHLHDGMLKVINFQFCLLYVIKFTGFQNKRSLVL